MAVVALREVLGRHMSVVCGQQGVGSGVVPRKLEQFHAALVLLGSARLKMQQVENGEHRVEALLWSLSEI